MTLKDAEYFIKAFNKQIKFNKRYSHSNIGYGGNVMPVLEIYQSLSEFSERDAFRKTITSFLESPNLEKREFAIDLCLGFFVFRDAIGR
ncbi:MAG: hypothetical protein IPP55_15530 [Anaerolineales bacterium]|nr:hypothetical protein [Anaerolineales bacterium]